VSWIDIVVIFVLALLAFIGFRRGLFKTLIPLLAIIAGVVVAGIFYKPISDWLSNWIDSSIVSNTAGFITIFVLFIAFGMALLTISRSLMGKSNSMLQFGRGGFTHTLLPLVGIMLAVALAGLFYGSVADLLSSWLDSRSQATIIAFFIVFVLVLIASVELFLIFASISTSKRPNVPMIGWVDRVGGLIFGLTIGSIMSGAFLSLAAKYSSPGLETTIKDSALAAFFLDHFPFVLHLLPNEFDTVRQFFG
jgi:membrane protein required for colicin V production